jgi:hypothetical protein
MVDLEAGAEKIKYTSSFLASLPDYQKNGSIYKSERMIQDDYSSFFFEIYEFYWTISQCGEYFTKNNRHVF